MIWWYDGQGRELPYQAIATLYSAVGQATYKALQQLNCSNCIVTIALQQLHCNKFALQQLHCNNCTAHCTSQYAHITSTITLHNLFHINSTSVVQTKTIAQLHMWERSHVPRRAKVIFSLDRSSLRYDALLKVSKNPDLKISLSLRPQRHNDRYIIQLMQCT